MLRTSPLLYIVTAFVAFRPSWSHSLLTAKFSHYEILTSRHISVRIRRDVEGLPKEMILTLSLFGRKVPLALQAGLPKSLLSPDAKLYAFHANGTKSKIDLDPNDFQQGVVKGHPTSRVNSFYHDGLWTINVVHPTMSFSVEPLSMHTGREGIRHMVAYRHRDIRMWSDSRMPFHADHRHYDILSHSPEPEDFRSVKEATNKSKFVDKRSMHAHRGKHSTLDRSNERRREVKKDFRGQRGRKRRNLKSEKVCDIIAIADNTFYNGLGGKSIHKTTKLLIQLYAFANGVFSSTKFAASKKVGIQIRGMEVHTHKGGILSDVFAKDNKQNGYILIRKLWQKVYVKGFCLAHVSTQRYLDRQLLGLAYGARKFDRTSGICGNYEEEAWNVGISTVIHKGRVLPPKVYGLILTHELGHSFGAKHDEASEECSPPASRGGLYLMWPQVSNGNSPNNNKFSPCSIKQINKVLMERPDCLVSKDLLDHATCGNGVVDYWEDCDAGNRHLEDPTGCCSPKCRFTPKAVCSPNNHPCCKNCTVAPKGEPCTNLIEHDCYDDSFCDGTNFHTCPRSRAKPNGQKCSNHGECQNGRCVNLCALLGLRQNPPRLLDPCNCDENRKAMCSICCQDKSLGPNSSCRSVGRSYEDQTPCRLGFCEGGVCKKAASMDNVIWNIKHTKNSNAEQKGLSALNSQSSIVIFTFVCIVIATIM